MEITDAIINDSVAQRPFGCFEPFVSGTDGDVWHFYSDVLSAMQKVPGIGVIRESDHYGSGYASYVAAFLYPSDGSTQRVFSTYIETIGILIYMSRLAPIAVFAASSRTDTKDRKGSSSGFIEAENVGILPDGDWATFIDGVTGCLSTFGIELLEREPLLRPAPKGIEIPTIFDGPYRVFDTLFYWTD